MLSGTNSLAKWSSCKRQAQRVGEDAVHLANALKGDSKFQGNWGEVILERILEQSGLTKGREYETPGVTQRW